MLALFAAFSVLAPAELVHFALVQHVVCADHGELVHESAAPHAAPQATAERSDKSGPAVHADAVAHDHEHCSFAATSREALALPPAHAVLTLASATSSEPIRAFSTAAAPGEALFRLAPKTSPPA